MRKTSSPLPETLQEGGGCFSRGFFWQGVTRISRGCAQVGAQGARGGSSKRFNKPDQSFWRRQTGSSALPGPASWTLTALTAQN